MTAIRQRQPGWFIPCRHMDEAVEATATPHPLIESLFARQHRRFSALLTAAEAHADILHGFNRASPPQPRWQQDWFPRLDGLAAYLMVRRHRPGRIVEVGAGHSTRFFAAALTDGGIDGSITAIDPAPRADLADLPHVRLIRACLQQAGTEAFTALRPGDVMSVDSSHIAMPGSDVDLLLTRILPHLPPGVLVHTHDIFLPDAYPGDWTWRGYNEQIPVSLLLTQGGWKPLWSSHYAATRMKDRVTRSVAGDLFLPAGAHESSLWMVRA